MTDPRYGLSVHADDIELQIGSVIRTEYDYDYAWKNIQIYITLTATVKSIEDNVVYFTLLVNRSKSFAKHYGSVCCPPEYFTFSWHIVNNVVHLPDECNADVTKLFKNPPRVVRTYTDERLDREQKV